MAQLTPDMLTALFTGLLVLATVVLAAVAWMQISENTKAGREIFARSSRQNYFSTLLANPSLSARVVDLDDIIDREKYFSFLSSLFSCADDALLFLKNEEFSTRILAMDIMAHLLFVSDSNIGKWPFHSSRRVLDFVLDATRSLVFQRKDLLSDIQDLVESKSHELDRFGLSDWDKYINETIGGRTQDMRKVVSNWVSTGDALIVGNEIGNAISQRPDFSNLPQAQSLMVLDFAKLKIEEVTNAVAVEMFERLISTLEGELGHAHS